MSQFQRFVAFLGCAGVALLTVFPPDAGGIHRFLPDGGKIDIGRLGVEVLGVVAATAAAVLLTGGRPGLPHERTK